MMKNYFLAAGLALAMGVGAQAQDLPEELYFVSNLNEWTTPDVASESQLTVLTPVTKGIYQCEFDYNVMWDFAQMGKIEFKLFSSKSNWDDPESFWGAGNGELQIFNNAPIVWDKMVAGPEGENFVVESYFPNKVYVSVDWNAKNVTLSDKPIEVEIVSGDMPEEMYFVGNINGWKTPDEATESELIVLNSTSEGIYECTFDYDVWGYGGKIQFKLFTSKSNWEDPESYWGGPEETINYSEGDVIVWKMFQGYEGADFHVETYFPGKVHIIVDWNEKTVTLTDKVTLDIPEELHIVGEFNNWDTENYEYQLGLSVADVEGTHFTGTFNLPAGEFKFVSGSGWEVNFGTKASYNLWSNESTTLPLVADGPNFNCMNWIEGGEITMDVDMDKMTVTFYTPGQPEYAIPESLHLVGVFNAWDAENHDFVLPLNKDVNHVEYSGVVEIPAGECEFKILSGDNWAESFGTSYTSGFDLWKGDRIHFKLIAGDDGNNFNCENWAGGRLSVVVNWSDYTVTLQGLDQPEYVKEDVLYLIGEPQGWDIKSGAMKLQKVDTGESKSALYAGSFDIPADKAMFRFYNELGNWEVGSIGSQYEDAPIEISLDSEESVFSGEAVWGKGSWSIPNWSGGVIDMTVDLNSMVVTFTSKTTGIAAVAAGENGLRYLNGVVTTSDSSRIVVVDATGRIIMTANGNSADLSELPSGLYIVKAGKKAMKVMK